jgi:putative Mg2+ transporter-C (MgtC) family protein
MEELTGLLSIQPLSIVGFLVTIICGGTIGFERQWFGKPAGIQTSILVCTGAYTFIALASYNQPDEGAIRVLGQVVTGVGFLGAGMMLSREGIVKGVTSAATIWVLAAVGSLVGFQRYGGAISLSALTLVILIGTRLLEKYVHKLRRGVHRFDQIDKDAHISGE